MRAAILVAAALSCAATLGCAGPTEPKTTQDGLVRHPTHGRGALFVKPGRHIGDYDKIWVAEMGITYAKGQEPLSPEQEKRIYQMLFDNLQIDMSEDSVVAAQEAGPCTVRFGLYATDLEFYESETRGSQKNFIDSYGTVTIVMEFRDSETNEPLVRYGRRRSLGAGTQEGPVEPDLHRLAQAIDAIMVDVGDRLAELVPERNDSRAHLGCEGLLGQSGGAAPSG